MRYVCNNPVCRKSFISSPSRHKEGHAAYCSHACWVEAIRGTLLARFWASVAICPHGTECVFCCWPWQGPSNEAGYGLFTQRVNGKWRGTRAHRKAWEVLNNQTLPEGLFGLHHCDNPSCCNGMHIYPGTKQQNAQDAAQRGRLIGRYHGKPACGEAVRQAKLTADMVRNIRERHANGEQQKVIAKETGMSPATISVIVHRKGWKHID